MANIKFSPSFPESSYLAQVRADFSARAPRYNTGDSGTSHLELVTNLVTLYPPRYPTLDIACGTGLLSTALRRRGAGLTGVDYTPAMLAVARRESPEGVFLEGRAEKLSLPDAHFGSAYICAALVYFTDVPAALREARRVLVDGGFLAYQAVTLSSYIAGIALETAVVRALGEARADNVFRLPHGITDTEGANVRLMEEAGFVDVEMKKLTQRSKLNVRDLEESWRNLSGSNAMTMRVNMLPEMDLEKVRKEYVQFLENRTDEEGLVADEICSWYVRGTKKGD